MGRYLVLGATGFIGASLLDVLRHDGHRIRAVVRTDGFEASDVEVVVEPDWTLEALQRATDDDFDAVFHLAGGGVRPDDRDPEALIASNVALTSRVARAVRPQTRIVYASTCAVYGRVETGHLAVETDPLRPIEPYGATKAGAAQIGRALAEARGVRFVEGRAFGVYGPSEPDYRLIPSLVAALRRGETLSLTPGEQSRDFMFVDDCARALAALGTTTELAHDVYNVCTGRPVTVAEIAKTTCRVVGAPASLLDFGAKPYRDGESMWMVGDPSRLEADTGVRPEVDLEAGIRRMSGA